MCRFSSACAWMKCEDCKTSGNQYKRRKKKDKAYS